MLAEERKAKILDYINSNKAVTATELMAEFDASEATIRRDLNELDQKGLISKVYGGAVSLENQINKDYNISEREDVNQDDKITIARYAASLIQDNDMVYLDAGTTTSHIIDYIEAKNITFVTNAIMHAKKLSVRGYRVYLTGGYLKNSTEALVGSDCYECISRYQFSISFLGTNAVNHANGFTTPDPEEAKIKECAIAHSNSPYILCDSSKFSKTSLVQFSKFEDACIITTGTIPKSYQIDTSIIVI